MKDGRSRRAGHMIMLHPERLLIFFGILLVGVLVPIVVLARIIVQLARLVIGGRSGDDTPEEWPENKLPVIKGPIALPAQLDIVQVATDGRGARCPVCATTFDGDDVVPCPLCQTRHHRDCWDFNGRCAIFACGPSKSAEPPPRKRTAGAASTGDDGFTEDLRRRFFRWYHVTRVQWWSLLLLSSIGAAVFLIIAVGGYGAGLFALMWVAGILVVVSIVLSLICLFARIRLEKSLGMEVPRVPPHRMKTLLDRMKRSRSAPLLWRMVKVFPLVYGLSAAAGLVLTMGTGASQASLLFFFGAILWGVPFVWLATWSARRHRAALERVRCRLRQTPCAGS